jgi:hypothetical protein
MSQNLASLVVSLEANIAKFSSDMTRAEQIAGNVGKNIEARFDSMGSAALKFAGALAAGASFAALKSMSDAAVATAAKFDDMAEATGLSVEKISQLAVMAKIGGHDMGALGEASTKLIKGLKGINGEGSATAAALKFLDVKANDATGKLRSMDDLLPEIAQKMAGYENSIDKSARAQDLFGKSGNQLLPLLNDLADAGRVNVNVTAEQAAAAERYEKTLKAIGVQKDLLIQKIVLDSLPAMQAFADIMLTSKTSADGLGGSIDRLSKDGSIATWATEGGYALAGLIDYARTTVAAVLAVVDSFKVVYADIAAIGSGLAALSTGNVAKLKQALDDRNATLEAANKRWSELLDMNTSKTRDAYEQQLKINDLVRRANSGEFADQNDRRAARAKPVVDYRGVDDRAQKAKTDIDELALLMQQLGEKAAGFENTFGKAIATLNTGLASGRITVEQYAVSYSQLIAQQPVYKKAQEDASRALEQWVRGLEEAAKALEKSRDAADGFAAAMHGLVEDAEFELSLVGRTADEVSKLTALRKIDFDVRRAAASLATDEEGRLLDPESLTRILAAADAAKERIGKIAETRGVLESTVRALTSIEQVGRDAFVGYISGAENAASITKRLESALKNGLYQLLWDMTAKEWFINIRAGVAGSGGNILSSLGSLFGGGGGGGNILSSLSSLFGGGGSGGGGGAFATTGGIDGPATAASNGSGMLGSLASLGGSMGGYIAAAIALSRLSSAGATALSRAFGQSPQQQRAASRWGNIGILPGLIAGFATRPGGAKEEGGSWQQFTGAGALANQAYYGGFPGNAAYRHTNPNDLDTGMFGAVGGIGASYFDFLRRAGASSNGVTFGLDFDRDPKGTAGSRIWGNVNDAQGNSIYRSFADVGRDPAKFESQMTLEAKRMLLAALKATDLPDAIDRLFANVDVSSITNEAADALMARAQAYADALKAINDSIAQLDAQLAGLADDGIAALTRQVTTLRDNVTAARAAWNESLTGDDPTAQLAAQQALMQAVMARYEFEAKAIDDLKNQILSIQSGRYDFRGQMQNRYAGIGYGSDSTFAHNMRLGQLQGNIDGATNPEQRLGFINAALATVDNMVAGYRETVQRRYAALERAQQDSLALQTRAIDMRREGLEAELALLGDMAGAAESARAAIRSLTFSGANPLSGFGRLNLAGADVESLRTRLQTAQGGDRANIANQLIQALQGRLSQAAELYQRPSDEYVSLYNETMRYLGDVESLAQTDAARALALQEQIQALTVEQNALTQNLIDYTAQMNADIQAFNDTMLPIYQRLESQGLVAYDAAERAAAAQLAVLGTQMDLLSDIRSVLREIRDKPNTPTTSGVTLKGASDRTPVVLQVDGRQMDAWLVVASGENARAIKQKLETA